MKRVQNVTAADFGREVLFSPVPVVVDVYADWCGPCRSLAPLLEKYAELYAGEVKFVKVNLDEEPEVAEVYRGWSAGPGLAAERDVAAEHKALAEAATARDADAACDLLARHIQLTTDLLLGSVAENVS